jgi:large subunit ribosomal protein L35Ae
MEGIISNFRRSRHTTYKRQMVIKVSGVNSKESAEKIVGKKVSWTSPANKVIPGVISAAHGSNGAVRAIFEKGLPGQSISTKVLIE